MCCRKMAHAVLKEVWPIQSITNESAKKKYKKNRIGRRFFQLAHATGRQHISLSVRRLQSGGVDCKNKFLLFFLLLGTR